MMLTAHGYNEAVIVAHSLGTAVASWVANLAPKRVAGLVLVDPICFLLNYHHVAFNMLHRIPERVIEASALLFLLDVHSCLSVFDCCT